MGGLGPGVGGLEILVIGLIALLVVGPKDLPLLMRRVGQFVGKARAMANEFRASFDEMARQSELDELRKEVEALRSGQGMYALGADAEEAFKGIRQDLEAPLEDSTLGPAATDIYPPAQAAADGVGEWPDPAPEHEPAVAAVKPPSKPRAKKTVSADTQKDAPNARPRKAAAKTTPRRTGARAKKADL